jgi:hypothetical protein
MCYAEFSRIGPLKPQVHGKAMCIVRSLLRDQAPDQPQILPPSKDVAAVSINQPCLRKGAIYLRMSGTSDPLARAGHHRPHGTRLLAEQRYVILFTIEFKGWSVAVREMVGFLVGTRDGILVILW